MITLILSIVALILGYFFYGRFVEKVFGPDPARVTPAHSKADGMDYVVLPSWKVFMIQFLNIAGTGPIFGAILGARFGPSCYLWIVLGCIFGGAVHDYFTGMLSVRSGGAGLPELVGEHLSRKAKPFAIGFSAIMLLLVGAVFVYSPAMIIGDLTSKSFDTTFIWVSVILVYYILATLVPIDKIIGKIYPVFAVALLFMAVSLLVCLLVKWPSGIPEIWDGLGNRNPSAGSIFPCLFITIACGAVSGFHATQSPLMARCVDNEKLGRPVFYGAMVTEGIVALIWAAVSSYFFFCGGNVEMGAEGVTAAPKVVTIVSQHWLGVIGGLLAILGVVAAPITSGDTALRSVRLVIADALHLDQGPIRNRLIISVPIFLATGALLWFNVSDETGFDKIWRYFGWANQTLAALALWTVTAFLSKRRKSCAYFIAMLPAAFMTSVTLTYILTAPIGFRLPSSWIPYLGTGIFAAGVVLFYIIRNKRLKGCLAV